MKRIVKKLGMILIVVLGLVMLTFVYYNKTKRKIALTERERYTNSLYINDITISHKVTEIHVSETLNTDKPFNNKSMIRETSYSPPWKAPRITTENELMFVSKHDKYFEGHSSALQASSSPNVKSNRTEINNSLVNPGKSRVIYTNGTIVEFLQEKEKTESSPGFGVMRSKGAKHDSWWGGIKEEFARRSRIVRKVCLQFRVGDNASTKQSLPNTQPKDSTDTGFYFEQVIPNRFLLARSASTMTCLINKVASTSLAVSLLKADGRPVPSQWSKLLSPHNAVAVLRPETEAEFNFARKYFFKFVLVRHPFERLLSAYRDKVERADHWSLKELRRHITSTLKEARQETAPLPPPLPAARGEGGDPVPITTLEATPDTGHQHNAIPTFSDFLEFILYTNLSDEFASHWAPYWQTCSPCSINYDLIAKLETANQDLKPVWRRMGLNLSDTPWYNRSSRPNKSSRTETLCGYYKQVSPSLIAKVYRHYQLDFHLFQYDILEVFRQGGHCNTQDCAEMISYL